MERSQVMLALPAGLDVALLCGTNDCVLRKIEEVFGARVALREEQVVVTGSSADLPVITSLLADLISMAQEGSAPTVEDVQAGADVLRGSKYAPAMLRDDVLLTYRGKAIRPKTAGQKRYVDAIRANTVTFGIGPAGTGKTYLAMAMAVSALKSKDVERIVLTRPAVEAGEKLGFLPGDLNQKVDPYLRPLYDAMFEMLGAETCQRMQERGIIEVAPLAYMRGRTLSDAFIILDEAQNTTQEQMKMFLTRMGFRSKIVVTGDPSQIDLPRGRKSGLIEAMEVLDGVPDIAVQRLTHQDVVRHELVQAIVRAYDAHALRAKEERFDGRYAEEKRDVD